MFCPPARILLLLLLAAGTGGAATTQVATDKPIVNFRLPGFTPEGNRDWLVRGSEGRILKDGLVDITGLNLSIFDGLPDGKMETLILSPSARVDPTEQVVRGADSIRVIDNRFEATGVDWMFSSRKDKASSQRENKVSIGKNVRVVLHIQLKDILQ
jgi:hypothetical protein